MILKTIKFNDRRTDRIFGIEFVDGVSQEPVPNMFIEKLRQLGDGTPFQIIEEEYVPAKRKSNASIPV